MNLPENRYSFTAKKYKRSSAGKKIIIIAAITVICGVLLYVFLPKTKNETDDGKLSEIDSIYEYWNVKKYDNVIETGKQLLSANPLQRKALALVGFLYFYKVLGE